MINGLARWIFILSLCANVPVIAQNSEPSRPPTQAPTPVSATLQETKKLELPVLAPTSASDIGTIFFVGTATVIIRFAGFTILTDPNFLHKGDHVHLGYGLHSERLTEPAINIDELPKIDFVLLSHYHGDHFDQIVEERLHKEIPIVSTPEAVEKLHEKKFTRGIGLRTWEALTIAKGNSRLRITAMPARHGPPGVAAVLPTVMGSMVEFLNAQGTSVYRLYISGDTLMYGQLKEIPKRYPAIDLALLHLGGTSAAGILVTMNAEQGVEALKLIDPTVAIPIHFNDYTVFKSPLSDFVKAVQAAGLESKVHYLKQGETFSFTARTK